MKFRAWFLPESADVIAQLGTQADASVDALDALVAWAHGDPDAADRFLDAEQRAGACKRALWRALRAAFSTPLDPEDLYSLSFRLDLVLSDAHRLVRDTEVLGLDAADPSAATMATLVRDGVDQLRAAFRVMTSDRDQATEHADQARHTARSMEHAYRDAMSGLRGRDDLRQVWAQAQRYGHFGELADRVVQVSDRVWYTVVKES